VSNLQAFYREHFKKLARLIQKECDICYCSILEHLSRAAGHSWHGILRSTDVRIGMARWLENLRREFGDELLTSVGLEHFRLCHERSFSNSVQRSPPASRRAVVDQFKGARQSAQTIEAASCEASTDFPILAFSGGRVYAQEHPVVVRRRPSRSVCARARGPGVDVRRESASSGLEPNPPPQS
jgi:hypothetical protein